MNYWIIFATILLAFLFRKQIYKYEFKDTDGLSSLLIEWVKFLFAIIAYLSTMLVMALIYTMLMLYAIVAIKWIVYFLT